MYVSEAATTRLSDAAVLELVEKAKVTNQRLGITGALIFTGSHFAQLLEGEFEKLQCLYRAIEHDPRHRNVTLVDWQRVNKRLFPTWGLAYWGAATYVNEPIEILLRRRDRHGQALRRVYELMAEFSRDR